MNYLELESTYKNLVKWKNSMDVELNHIVAPLKTSLKRYWASNCGATLDSLDIYNIENGIVYYRYQSMFHDEYDDPVWKEIPIEYCESYQTVESYYKLLKEKEEAEYQQSLLQQENEIKAFQEDNERLEYDRLKKKFG